MPIQKMNILIVGNIKMNEKKKLQSLILDIAEEIEKICEKNGIEYFMDGGTQLGAVRHGGFIPWDDDFDIAMKRADYEKFIKVCESELDQQKFFLQTGRTEKYYCFSFAKVQLKGTEILEDFSKDVNIRHGIFVDIFPYDKLPDNIIRRYIFLAINHLFKNLLWTKCGYGVSWQKKKFSYILSRIGGSVFSIDKLKQLRDAHIKKYNSVNTEYCFNSDYPKNHLNNLLFLRKKKYVFENKRFWGFEDSDNFLKTLYGPTYMELPPEEDRKEHSKYKINFGDYQ